MLRTNIQIQTNVHKFFYIMNQPFLLIPSTGDFRFRGILLVCDETLPNTTTFFWAGPIRLPNINIDVIAFKTNQVSDIKVMLENDLKVLKKLGQTPNIKQQIAFIESTLKMMAAPEHIRKPEKILLDIASKGLKLDKLEEKDVIYLSWVCGSMK